MRRMTNDAHLVSVAAAAIEAPSEIAVRGRERLETPLRSARLFARRSMFRIGLKLADGKSPARRSVTRCGLGNGAPRWGQKDARWVTFDSGLEVPRQFDPSGV